MERSGASIFFLFLINVLPTLTLGSKGKRWAINILNICSLTDLTILTDKF